MPSTLTRSSTASRRYCKLSIELLEDRFLLSGGVIALPITPQFGHPQVLTRGGDGNVWFTETTFSPSGKEQLDHIGRITPNGQLTEFPIPSSLNSTQGFILPAITAGPDGNIWFAELTPGKLARITPSGAVTEFQTLTPTASVQALAAGPDGNVWFTEESGSLGPARVGRITSQGVVTEFLLANYSGAVPSITAGPDGNLWFSEQTAERIGRITPSGVITEFPVPAGFGATGVITAGADGNLWFTGFNPEIGRMTTQGQATAFALPPNPAAPPRGPCCQAYAYNITSGPDGNLWFAEVDPGVGHGQVGRITPGGAITQFPLPCTQGAPLEITAGSDGDLWFLNYGLFGQPFGKFVLTVSGSPNQRWVSQVYLDLLHRNVDPGGLAAWTSALDQGVPRWQVAQAIENSDEYWTDEVTLLYCQILSRSPDPGGLAVWKSFLAQGGTQEQLQAILYGSDEYFQNVARNDNGTFLSLIYDAVLHRDIDPSGMQSWSQQLNRGVSRTAVALGILQSLESDQDEVQILYHQYLHRPADSAGLNAFTNALQQGLPNERAVALILGSDEYFQDAVS